MSEEKEMTAPNVSIGVDAEQSSIKLFLSIILDTFYSRIM